MTTDSPFNGPAHGLPRYAKEPGITFVLGPRTVVLKVPRGVTVDFCTTYQKQCYSAVCDACKYAASRKLDIRLNGDADENGERAWQAMDGITPMVNSDATCQMIHSQHHVHGIQNPTQFLDTDEEGKRLLKIDKPCILLPRNADSRQYWLAAYGVRIASYMPNVFNPISAHVRRVETSVSTPFTYSGSVSDGTISGEGTSMQLIRLSLTSRIFLINVVQQEPSRSTR